MTVDNVGEHAAQMWLLSPLAIVGGSLLLAQILGLALHARGIPKLYGAVLAGLILGASGFRLVDAPLLSQFEELFNAAAALVLFEVGRKMDVAWIARSGYQGASLILGCLLRGGVVAVCLAAFGLSWGESLFVGAILIAANPIIFASMVSDSEASGVATYASANAVGLSNMLALLVLGIALAWMKSHAPSDAVSFWDELGRQGVKMALGIAIALLCYALYMFATRLCKAQATMRPGILIAVLLVDLGLCSVSSASALLSLLLMGVLLRNAERRDNVFQAQIKTGQDIGYALLFLMSASLVDVQKLIEPPFLVMAGLIFILRILVTRLALLPTTAWSPQKKNAMALSLSSLVSFGMLVVDSSMIGMPGLSAAANDAITSLLGLNVLIAPGLTWWGLKMAGETRGEGA